MCTKVENGKQQSNAERKPIFTTGAIGRTNELNIKISLQDYKK